VMRPAVFFGPADEHRADAAPLLSSVKSVQS
jgi:hypothetical protein